MPIGCARAVAADRFVPAAEIRRRVEGAFALTPLAYEPGRSSRDFMAEDRRGRRGVIGFISSETQPFCVGCARLRLTSTGEVIGCLSRGRGISDPQIPPVRSGRASSGGHPAGAGGQGPAARTSAAGGPWSQSEDNHEVASRRLAVIFVALVAAGVLADPSEAYQRCRAGHRLGCREPRGRSAGNRRRLREGARPRGAIRLRLIGNSPRQDRGRRARGPIHRRLFRRDGQTPGPPAACEPRTGAIC